MTDKLKYYNHALVANCEDCESISLTKEEIKTAFKENRKALFIVYTSNFDCGYDTGWYYVIRDSRENHLEKMSSRHRYNLRQALKRIDCRMIIASNYAERIKEIGFSATSSYKNYNDNQKFEYGDHRIIVGAFLKDTDYLVGFEILKIGRNQVSLVGEKVDDAYRKLGVSYALNAFIVQKYLMEDKSLNKYISNGQRTINHETNHNYFLIDNLGFRKAYCFLHILYRPSIRIIMPILRFFRIFLKSIKKPAILRSLSSVLEMDKTFRNQQRKCKNNV